VEGRAPPPPLLGGPGPARPPAAPGSPPADGRGPPGTAPLREEPRSRHVTEYRVRNRLFYDGSQQGTLALTARELALRVGGAPKEIRHANTRLGGGGAGPASGDTTPGASTPGSLRGEGRETPGWGRGGGEGGYERLATPVIVPGGGDGGAPPLMTFGTIGGTPVRLEEEDDVDVGEGPAYRMPAMRAKDVAGDVLGAGSAVLATGALGAARRGASRAGATPLLGGVGKAARAAGGAGGAGGAGLSPAARRLASSLRRGTPARGDAALRASYGGAPGARQTGPRAASRLATPDVGGAAAAARAGRGCSGDITDGLLELG